MVGAIPGLSVVLLPVVIAVIVFFAKVPEAGRRFSVRLRVAVGILCGLTAIAALIQQHEESESKKEDARSRVALTAEIARLRTVSPLRKEAADLTKEILDFYHERERYNERFKAGQALSDAEAKATLSWYRKTVSLYHERFEGRVVAILEQIRTVTGMDVSGTQRDARAVKYEPQIEQVASRLSALAASLP